MCGVLGIVTTAGRSVRVDDADLERMRDTMAHRGPDGAGLWRCGNVALAHRRLAVMDPGPGGHQPMSTGDGRYTLVYNGELYNDADLRRRLARQGVRFGTACDTETVLAALAAWGAGALEELRGMFALGLYDRDEQTLLLARDPLGIKPLFYWRRDDQLAFASEIPALLAHPEARIEPDLEGVSAYLTSIRTVLGSGTMFRNVSAVQPGECLIVRLGGDRLEIESTRFWSGPTDARDADAGEVRSAVEDSIRRHLRADVPTCCLLSGGLDSAIVARVADESIGAALWTYCAGCPSVGGDLQFAARLAGEQGYHHAEARIDGDLFARRWPEMVEATGSPLSTPNEVAIHEVALRLRGDGKVVTISGEGADELFGGYVGPIESSLSFIESVGTRGEGAGRFLLDSSAWVSRQAKETILNERTWRALEHDGALLAGCEREFERARRSGPDDEPLQAHLRFQRRVNLVGLLGRLDSATMLASVEGRTPLADRVVADLAESLPIRRKVRFEGGRVTRTKVALREAFAGRVPGFVLDRPKASFPLPFQGWMHRCAGALEDSDLIRSMFRPEAIALVRADPERLWSWAWPMVNLAMWDRRWWGGAPGGADHFMAAAGNATGLR